MNYDEQQALEEAHYWHTVQHMSDYVELYGYMKVTKDIFSALENRRQAQQVSRYVDMADVPF
jgi:hypothetical protein